jgi:hypothetical protein
MRPRPNDFPPGTPSNPGQGQARYRSSFRRPSPIRRRRASAHRHPRRSSRLYLHRPRRASVTSAWPPHPCRAPAAGCRGRRPAPRTVPPDGPRGGTGSGAAGHRPRNARPASPSCPSAWSRRSSWAAWMHPRRARPNPARCRCSCASKTWPGCPTIGAPTSGIAWSRPPATAICLPSAPISAWKSSPACAMTAACWSRTSPARSTARTASWA